MCRIVGIQRKNKNRASAHQVVVFVVPTLYHNKSLHFDLRSFYKM